MKKFIQILAAVAVIATMALAAQAKKPTQTETAVFSVTPAMTCQNCENKIKSNLRFVKGINAIATDLKSQTVTVSFNPEKTDKQKIAEAFAKIGYQATEGAPAGCNAENPKPDAAKSRNLKTKAAARKPKLRETTAQAAAQANKSRL